MLSIDTNILLYALNRDADEFEAARDFLQDCSQRDDVAICDLVLVEIYNLLRNPAVINNPLPAREAGQICTQLRNNQRWAIIETAPIMTQLWQTVNQDEFPRRRIFDLRIALTVQHHGVTHWATRNLRNFQDLGFEQIINPIPE